MIISKNNKWADQSGRMRRLVCTNVGHKPQSSALDKLLGQLVIYATWLSSIAYLQKQLRIFIFFLRHIFFLWLHVF